MALGAAISAYRHGVLDIGFLREQVEVAEKDHQGLREHNEESTDREHLKQETNVTTSSVETVLKNNEASSEIIQVDSLNKSIVANDLQENIASTLTPHSDATSVQSVETPDDEITKAITQVEPNLHKEVPEVKPIEQHEPVETTSLPTQANAIPTESQMKSSPVQHHIPKSTAEVHNILVDFNCYFPAYRILRVLAFRTPRVMK